MFLLKSYVKILIGIYLVSVILFSITRGKFEYGIQIFRETEVIVPFVILIAFETFRILNNKKSSQK